MEASNSTNSPQSRDGSLRLLIVLSIIPFFGILFAGVVMFRGVKQGTRSGNYVALRAAAMVLAGNFGILWVFFTAVTLHPGLLHKLAEIYTQENINALVVPIEAYKKSTGIYPLSLKELHKAQPPGVIVTIVDPMNLVIRKRNDLYFYRITPDARYILRSSGLDGVVFSNDDIVPAVPPSLAAESGLVVNR